MLICKGEKKQTNHHRLLLGQLVKGMIPSHWKEYTIPQGSTVIQWVTDFGDRVQQLQKISSSCSERGASALKSVRVWLGGLFNPEAYITATRQYVAQANSWSLEELTLIVEIEDSASSSSISEDGFGLTGLKLQGAKTNKNKLYLDSSILTELPLVNIRWLKVSPSKSTSKVTLPVYLNGNRSELLFTIDLEAAESELNFFERGVAFIASTAFG